MSSPVELWESFFKSCDIPGKVRARYAQKFVKERIQPYLLKGLGTEELTRLGIDVYGDQLAIINYVKRCKGNPPEFMSSDRNSSASASEHDSEIGDDEEMEFDESPPRIASEVVNKNYRITKQADIDSYEIKPTKRVENKHPINQIVRFKMDPPAKFSEVGSRSTTAKKVQINDVSSSSIPLTSGLRSDQISTKTMVVTSPQRPLRSTIPPEFNRVVVEGDHEVKIKSKPPILIARRQANYSDLDDLEVEVRPRIPKQRVIPRVSPTSRMLSAAGIRRKPKITRGGVPLNTERFLGGVTRSDVDISLKRSRRGGIMKRLSIIR